MTKQDADVAKRDRENDAEEGDPKSRDSRSLGKGGKKSGGSDRGEAGTGEQEASNNEVESRRRHFTMLRSFTPADLLTLANASCGMGAILLAVRFVSGGGTGLIWAALVLLPVALVCDFLDGYVARKTGRASILGADLDSLSDIVSFGVAPAVIGHALGLNGVWDSFVLVFFVACGISRLARFNVTAEDMSDESGKVSHFEGTPIPTSVLIAVALAVLLALGRVGPELPLGAVSVAGWDFHPFVLVYLLSGAAMVSATLKIPKP